MLVTSIKLPCPNCKTDIEVNLAFLDPTKESIIEVCKSCNKPSRFKKEIYNTFLDDFLQWNKKNTPKSTATPHLQDEKTNVASFVHDDKTNIAIPSPIFMFNTFKLIDTTTKKEYFLQKNQKNVIGKKANISLETEDGFISRQHCCIEILDDNIKGSQAFLYDNNTESPQEKPSTNGTFFGGSENPIKPTDKIQLKSGDKIRLGKRSDFIFLMFSKP